MTAVTGHQPRLPPDGFVALTAIIAALELKTADVKAAAK
jgi:hypothetical protein